MKLEEILRAQGLDEEQVVKVIGDMKQNKIFTAGEENLDIRFGKLKGDYDTLAAKSEESDKLIAELQKANADNEGIQAKIAEYEAVIAKKDEELARTKVEAAVKVALLNAKATDIDYLTFKLKEGETELKLDDEGNLKGIDDAIAGLKTQFPNQFEGSAQKKVEQKKLPDPDNRETVTKEQFAKMGYQQRLKLHNENPEAYKELSGQ